MKITRIELHLIRVPFDMGAVPQAFAGMAWTSVDTLFVRVCTDAGVDGWGEGWGHVACPITASALATLVGPAFIGRSVDDRAGLERFQLRPHERAALAGLHVLELDDAPDVAVDLNVHAVPELVRGDGLRHGGGHSTVRSSFENRVNRSRPSSVTRTRSSIRTPPSPGR